jgi:hypothetical protein
MEGICKMPVNPFYQIFNFYIYVHWLGFLYSRSRIIPKWRAPKGILPFETVPKGGISFGTVA